VIMTTNSVLSIHRIFILNLFYLTFGFLNLQFSIINIIPLFFLSLLVMNVIQKVISKLINHRVILLL
jgi:hypothetical protein